MSRSGFVAVVGRPNVGKSTLVNALVGDKVSITSSRPQTTRNTIRGVLTIQEPPTQYVFVDTPGVHRPRTALGERLNQLVAASLEETDAAIFVLDATQRIGPGDRLIAGRLNDAAVPSVVVVNKVDIAGKDAIVEQLAEAGEWDMAAYVPISAATGDGIERVLAEVDPLLTEGPFFFPPDVVTDQPEALLIAELVREKYLDRLRDELPHSLAVVTGDIEERANGTTFVPVTVYVERKSQKGIVIGKGGELLRRIGTEARVDVERLLGTPVYLDLRVRVEKDWQRRDQLLDRLGF